MTGACSSRRWRKRVGITAAALFLHRNGVTVHVEEDEAYDLVIAVAEGRRDVPDIAEQLATWNQ